MIDQEDLDESAYKVTLPSFKGPLDLLLHLIKQHKIDIYDIPIALITEQYNEYLDAMEELSLDVAADYIYMAALLIHIKSKMLLPRDESSEMPQEDPREELVKKLLEYQRYKAVAETFAELDVVRMGMWSRPLAPLRAAFPRRAPALQQPLTSAGTSAFSSRGRSIFDLTWMSSAAM